jgi:alpha-L-rhamnosidase
MTTMTANGLRTTVTLKPLVQHMQRATASRVTDDGALWLDFGRAAFGTVIIPVAAARALVVHLGEKLDDTGRIDRSPPGTIRYRRIEQQAQPGDCRIVIPPDERNTKPGAILMPTDIGEVLPFRYVEIENAADIQPDGVQQVAVHYPFDDDAASFRCSSDVLNAVWDLCKYSIKATTFCGVYVDGDRERIPYEGDAYINQLGHYGVDHEYDFARYSHEYMIQRPTWCTEWHLHSVLMAWADYLYTGDTTSITEFYDELVAKTLIDFAREDGLISVDPELRTPEIAARVEPHFESGIIKRNIRDVVDWPPGSFTRGGTGERDDHEMRPINTVVNAFHYHALRLMAKIAAALDHHDDQARFDQHADRVHAAINRTLFHPATGLYIDGEGSTHASLHSNMFALAFELVPEQRKPAVVEFVKSRGMACSVYGAQHLLDALYMNGQDRHATKLMTATHDRSWHNMIAAGSTITLEAWDWKYKNNLDWNHAWGAAPANIIPRWVLGVRPASPGFTRAIVQPMLGDLEWAEGTVPTPHGPIHVRAEKAPGGTTVVDAETPPGCHPIPLFKS